MFSLCHQHHGSTPVCRLGYSLDEAIFLHSVQFFLRFWKEWKRNSAWRSQRIGDCIRPKLNLDWFSSPISPNTSVLISSALRTKPIFHATVLLSRLLAYTFFIFFYLWLGISPHNQSCHLDCERQFQCQPAGGAVETLVSALKRHYTSLYSLGAQHATLLQNPTA